MQRQTPIFIVTSSRPRVGKTLIARALIEFFCAQRRAGRGLRRQSRRIHAARLPAGLHRRRQHPRHPRRDGAVRPARRRRRGAEGRRPRRTPVRAVLRGDAADRFRRRGAAPGDRADGAVRGRSRRPRAPGLRHAEQPLPRPRAGAGAQRGRAADRALPRQFSADAARRRAGDHPGAVAGAALGGRPAGLFVRRLCRQDRPITTAELYDWTRTRVRRLPRPGGAAAARRSCSRGCSIRRSRIRARASCGERQAVNAPRTRSACAPARRACGACRRRRARAGR